MTTNAPVTDGRHDFDFIHGRWHVHNRRLVDMTDPGCDEWIEYAALGEAWRLLGDLGNVDTFSVPPVPDAQPPVPAFEGATLRLFEPATGLWRIWWMSSKQPGVLDEPMVGRFTDGKGLFEGADQIGGRAVLVRFDWDGGATPRWQQSFSFDDGASWRPNWIMTFTPRT
jgi:hypothetical protein